MSRKALPPVDLSQEEREALEAFVSNGAEIRTHEKLTARLWNYSTPRVQPSKVCTRSD